MDPVVVAVFVVVYAGMILGELPGLAVDRSGIALLGAIALLATGRLTLEEAWRAIDAPTLALLFGLMVISAQFRLGGFYTEMVSRLAARAPGPETLFSGSSLPRGHSPRYSRTTSSASRWPPCSSRRARDGRLRPCHCSSRSRARQTWALRQH